MRPALIYAGPLRWDLQSARVAGESPRLCASSTGESKASRRAALSSDLERLTLRQAEIFFGERGRELQLAQRSLNNSSAGVITAGDRPHEESGRNSPEGG